MWCLEKCRCDLLLQESNNGKKSIPFAHIVRHRNQGGIRLIAHYRFFQTLIMMHLFNQS